jgi:hypothetical protein
MFFEFNHIWNLVPETKARKQAESVWELRAEIILAEHKREEATERL